MYLVLVSLHLLAAVVWIGGMLFLSLVLAPLMRSPTAVPEWRAMFRAAALRFRRVVYGAVVVLVGTGPLLVSERGFSVLQPAAWPLILQVKVGLVAVLLILTAVHDLVLGPQMRTLASRPEHLSAWDRSLMLLSGWLPRVSVLLGLIVLGTASVLARS